MAILSIQHISKTYGSKKVLDDINFDIEKGDIFGLLGSNGAGKSTLTKIILGFENPTLGTIKHSGKNKLNKKSNIAIVPQNIAAYLDFTVEENMVFFAALTNLSKKVQKERINDLITWLELETFRKVKIRFLSGGYQRLVNMALSIINNPDIIFLDEPTVGLDPKMRKMFWEKLKTLQKSGKTLILTTHYMDEAEHLCTKVAMLKKGKLITTGSSKGLIKKFGGENILSINLNKELDEKIVSKIASQEHVRIQYKNKQLILAFSQTHGFGDIVNVIKKYLNDNNYEIVSAYLKEPNLEDVFFNLTGDKL